MDDHGEFLARARASRRARWRAALTHPAFVLAWPVVLLGAALGVSVTFAALPEWVVVGTLALLSLATLAAPVIAERRRSDTLGVHVALGCAGLVSAVLAFVIAQQGGAFLHDDGFGSGFYGLLLEALVLVNAAWVVVVAVVARVVRRLVAKVRAGYR